MKINIQQLIQLALKYTKFYYRLGMAKSEGPSISNFMHQMLTLGHTEHTTSFPGLDAPVKEDKHTTVNSISSEINKVLL